jgi:hypothetical protein
MMKNKIEELFARAREAYGHEPSMAELTALMIYERAAGKTPTQNALEAHHSHVHTEDGHVLNSTFEKAYNALEDDLRDSQRLQETALYLAASRLEAEMALAVEAAIRAGDFEEAEDLLKEAEQSTFARNMMTTLAGFYLVVYPIYANQLMQARARELETQGVFAMTQELIEFIDDMAERSANSHVNTVRDDLINAVEDVWEAETRKSLFDMVRAKVNAREGSYLDMLPNNPNDEDILKAVNAGTFDDREIYAEARKQARTGAGLEEMARTIHKKYENISRTRATTIARHETNRVFNMAQYQADVQFLTEANLMGRAFKVLRNRANDPCEFCEKLIEESRANPVPFTTNFVDLGEVLTVNYTKKNGKAGTKSLPINYEPITAGNVHVNCRCEYELVVKNEDGTVMNMVDLRVDNRGYNPYRDPKSGQFTTGAGSKPAQSTGTSGMKNTVLRGLVETAKENGGMTVSIEGNTPDRGIAYSPSKTTETRISEADFNEESLDAFVDKHWDMLTQPGMHIGGWFNEKDTTWYLDVSKVNEYNSRVIQDAQDAEQLAVFDLATFNEITIGEEDSNGKYTKIGEAQAIFDEAFGKRDEGTVQNSLEEVASGKEENGKVENRGYNPNREKDTGQFTFGTTAQKNKISELESSIRSDKTETFYAVNAKGDVISEFKGNSKVVKIPFEEAAKVASNKNSILTHNHPAQGTGMNSGKTFPFSLHDLRAVSMMNARGIRAVGATHEYSINRKGDQWPAPSQISRTYNAGMKKTKAFLMERVQSGEMTSAEAQFEWYHEAIKVVAEKYDLDYNRIEV